MRTLLAGLLIIQLLSCANQDFKLDEPSPISRGSIRVEKAVTKESNQPTSFFDEAPESAPESFEMDPAFWEKLSDTSGIKTYKGKTEVGGVFTFRGEGDIDAPLAKVLTLLTEKEYRKLWVDSLVEDKTVAVLSKYERLEYNRTKVPWPFQDRDFLLAAKFKAKKNPNIAFIEMHSVEDTRMPPVEGVVRGRIPHAKYFLKERKRDTGAFVTSFTLEMAVDPAGVIPKWIVALTQKKWAAHTIQALRNLSQDPSIVVNPEVLEYYYGKKGRIRK